MSRIQRIESLINQQFSVETLTIIDESHKHASHFKGEAIETHLIIKCHAAEFSSLTRVQSHRLLNTLLKPEFDSGLHAVSYQLS